MTSAWGVVHKGPMINTLKATQKARRGRLVLMGESAGRVNREAVDRLGARYTPEKYARPVLPGKSRRAYDKGFSTTFNKSYVPGSGYKPAKVLDHIERHIVRNKAAGNLAHNRKNGGIIPRAEMREPSRTKMYPDRGDIPKGKLKQVFPQFTRAETGAPPGTEGFSRPNGRGGGEVFVHRDAQNAKATYRHEMAHIKPKRNIVRFQQRMKDDFKRGREEGRADYIGHGKKTKGSYPGNDQFQRGYNDVQNRMLRAKRQKEGKRPFYNPFTGKVEKSLGVPGQGQMRAIHMNPHQRYAMKRMLTQKKNNRAGTIPGLGKLDGLGGKKQSIAPFVVRQSKKELRRGQRELAGQPYSPVKSR